MKTYSNIAEAKAAVEAEKAPKLRKAGDPIKDPNKKIYTAEELLENSRIVEDHDKALEYVIGVLQNAVGGKSYFTWEPVEEDRSFVCRIPLKGSDMEDMGVIYIHICRPQTMAHAIMDQEPEKTVAHSGYVRKGKCVRCTTAAPFPLGFVMEEEEEVVEVPAA